MSISKSIHKRVKRDRAGNETGHVWRAKYRDHDGKEHTRHFTRKADATAWLDTQTAGLVTGTHISPTDQTTTMRQWTAVWLTGYATRSSTQRQARTHIKRINAQFGDMRLGDIKASHINAWTKSLTDEGLAQSTVHALYRRLVQILAAAVEDRLIPRSPAGRKTSVPGGKQRIHAPTTDQVWDIYEAFPDHLKVSVLLAAFAGLRVAEVCGLRVADVAFLHREIRPAVQYGDQPLKTEASRWAIPLSDSLSAALSEHIRQWSGDSDTVLADPWSHQPIGPWTIERAFRKARPDAEMHFHDLRHYFASLLIAGGADVKVVQRRMRHEKAKTTLDTYTHLWPDSDEKSRATVEAVFAKRLADAG